MKRIFQYTTLICLLAICNNTFAQTRYLGEVFSSVTITSDVVYGNNLDLNSTPQDLLVDIYEPDTSLVDSLAERPLIIYVHSGSFIAAPSALQCTGSKTDSAVVEFCTQFAKRGYVVAAMSYRVGWNPFDPVQTERIRGLLNAAYRGIQDARTCVRWFRKNFEVGGNTYGIDTSKFIMFGQGTGGYISFASATMDRYDGELNLPKFIDPGCCCPLTQLCSVIDTALSGDLYGLGNRPLNTENHPGYSSKIHMTINLGGALADLSWLEEGDVPMLSIHNAADAFAPYTTDWVIVPITGELVVVVSGSHDAIRRANCLGNNDILCRNWTDPYSLRAETALVSHLDDITPHTEGFEGLFPLVLPTPSSPTWEWWDPTDPTGTPACVTNDPTKSKAISMAYIDTAMGFVNPRIVCALGLLDTNSCPTAKTCTSYPAYPDCYVTGIEKDISLSNFITIYPNPSSSSLTVYSENTAEPITGIELYDVTGRLLRSELNIRTNKYVMEKSDLSPGLYFINVRFKDNNLVNKVVFE